MLDKFKLKTMKRLVFLLAILVTTPLFAQETPLLKTKNPKVVAVATRLEGTWVSDNSLLNLPEEPKEKLPDTEFKIDNSVTHIFMEEYGKSPVGMADIYVAGRMKMFGKELPFVLLDFQGNPVLFYFGLENVAGPGEGTFDVKLAVGTKKSGDVLYLERLPGSYQANFALKRKTLNYNYSKENVVATHLVGTWAFDKKGAKSLTKNTTSLMELKVEMDSSIVENIPYKFNEFLDGKTVYLAGKITLNKESFPFILIELSGNPHLVYFKEKNGKQMENLESFNLFVAAGDTPKMDILFIGGDFNNQAFFPFKRK